MSYRRTQATAGAVLAGIGLGVGWAMHAFPDGLRVPPPIGYVAALAFFFAGLLAFSNAFGGPRVRAWLAVTVLLCLVLPAAWLAFGPGERQCGFALFGAFGLSGLAQGAVCRAGFGVASVLGLGMVALAVRQALGRRTVEPPARPRG